MSPDGREKGKCMRGGEARLFGVLGDPVDHSLSPAMQNAAFAACDLPYLYLRYRVPSEALPQAFAEARTLTMGGLNLTVPLKEVALELLDEVTPEARRIGAVNTVVITNGRLAGDNTDARGFLRALEGRVALGGAHVVVIGAGGSARAVGTALATSGCTHVTLANRTPSRAGDLARALEQLGPIRTTVTTLDALEDGIGIADARLVVNTTSTGLAAEPIAIRHGATPHDCVFMDLVYGTQPTPFLRAAARARRRTLDGSGMLLHQGALAFEAWTGRPAPLDAMRRALTDAGLPAGAMPAPKGH
jgi:shikimate dehydrogenase